MGKRDSSKSYRIGQSAAKSRTEKGSTTIPMGVESSDSKSLTRKIQSDLMRNHKKDRSSDSIRNTSVINTR